VGLPLATVHASVGLPLATVHVSVDLPLATVHASLTGAGTYQRVLLLLCLCKVCLFYFCCLPDFCFLSNIQFSIFLLDYMWLYRVYLLLMLKHPQ
jgi:hypothetical protein